MRIVRVLLMAAFIISLVLFGVTEVLERTGRDPGTPVIVSDRETLEIPCAYTREQLLEGLSAKDETDGDLTDQIILGTFSRFIGEGLSSMTYVVFDSDDQPGTLTRNVRFTDYHAPRFTLTEPLVFAVQEGSYSAAMERIGAQDVLDGDLTGWVTQTDTNLDYEAAGSYTMTVQVSNSFGDTSSAALPVHVTAAEQTLDIRLTEAIVYLQAGNPFDPGAFVADVLDGAGSSMGAGAASAQSGVDAGTPGTYEVHYTAADGAGNTGETWLTVIVEERQGGEADGA